MQRAQRLAEADKVDLALVIGAEKENHLGFALFTPQGCWSQRVKFSNNRHGLKARQDVSAMMALNMLRRWLDGLEVTGGHGWIDVVETQRG